MLKITKVNNSIKVEGLDNKHFPDNGTLIVPVNSVILTLDESGMATFRSSVNNDVLFSGIIDDITIDGAPVTRDTIADAFNAIANTSTGGGGGTAVDAYTKAESDAKFATKTEVDDIQNVLGETASQDSVDELSNVVGTKQDKLVSGTNIKSINGISILGEGDIEIQAGTGVEQRVLVDGEDYSNLKSGFYVESPHWKNTGKKTMTLNSLMGNVGKNVVNTDGYDKYDRDNYLKDEVEFKLVSLKNYGGVECYQDYIEFDGNIYATASGARMYLKVNDTVIFDTMDDSVSVNIRINEGDVITVAQTNLNGYDILNRLFTVGSDNLLESDCEAQTWEFKEDNTHSAVHDGNLSPLVAQSDISSVVASSMGQLRVGIDDTHSSSIGKFNQVLKLYFGETNFSNTTNGRKMTPTISDSSKNLTIGFDETYSTQTTVQKYWNYGGDFGSTFADYGIYGGNINQGTYPESDKSIVKEKYLRQLENGKWYIDVPVNLMVTELEYPKCLMIYQENFGDSTFHSMALTVGYPNAGNVSVVKNSAVYNDSMGHEINLPLCFNYKCNDNIVSPTSDDGFQVLAEDVTALTSFGIIPTDFGHNQYSGGNYNAYISPSLSVVSYSENGSCHLFPYEGTEVKYKNYRNEPDKLNHYIRYAGETGTTVAERKAYILTDKNVAQAEYIKQLESRMPKFVTISQADYDALTDKDGNTLYIIV